MFTEFRHHILEALARLTQNGVLPESLDFSRVTAEPPRDPSHGDISTNAAMVLAKDAGAPPRKIAEALLPLLNTLEGVEEVSIAGPGFINLKMTSSFWHAQLHKLLNAGEDYGSSTLGQGQKINLEYVSANPTGPLHAGHGRVSVMADALANLLEKVGYDVCREFYINDAGNQAEKLARSTYLRYREVLGEDIGEIPEGCYPGDYLIPVGEAIAKKDGDKWRDASEEEWLEPFRQYAVDAMMVMIREDLALMGIHHEVFTSEMTLHRSGAIERVIDTLKARDLVYRGTLEPPKGKEIEDWEPRPQLLFRATEFGDDVDRPLQKSNGSWTYFTADIAYHYDKFCRGFNQMIDVWGADHGGYVKRITSAVKAITENKGHLDVILCQIVNFTENGEPVRMSKRLGTFITVKDVIDQVGKDVFRFMMVSRKGDAHLDFDFAKVMEQSKDNPVFYVNYAHARCHSVLRMASEQMPGLETDVNTLRETSLSTLGSAEEIALIRLLAGWPRQVEIAAATQEPHRLCYYLYEIAAQFHMLWNKGKEEAVLRFILPENPETTAARLALIHGVIAVIASGLKVFGVKPLEEMR